MRPAQAMRNNSTQLLVDRRARAALDQLGGAGRAGANVAALRPGAGVADAISSQAAFGLTGTGPDASGVSHVLSYAAEPAEQGADCREGARRPRRRATGACGEFLGGGANIAADNGRAR